MGSDSFMFLVWTAIKRAPITSMQAADMFGRTRRQMKNVLRQLELRGYILGDDPGNGRGKVRTFRINPTQTAWNDGRGHSFGSAEARTLGRINPFPPAKQPAPPQFSDLEQCWNAMVKRATLSRVDANDE